jgi:serine phosphatase RsbU (regulator of sigma subunit)
MALLPFDEKIKKGFPEHFILFKPRDIVSGDFYWMESIENLHYLAAVDCTGHGVPGAFMSMLGHAALNDAFFREHLTDPAAILLHMDRQIQQFLQQESTANQDGMDMALCMLDQNSKQLHFAGAKRPLLYSKNNEIVKLKGDPFGIGGISTRRAEKFITQTIPIDQPTTFFLFSDGYPDQFGGEKG